MENHTLISLNDMHVWATPHQKASIDTLLQTKGGRIASVTGYRPSSAWIESPVQDIQFLSRVSTVKIYARRIAELSAIRFNSIAEQISKDPILSAMPHKDLVEIFKSRMEFEITQMTRTLAGDRTGSHREAHDRCYESVGAGVKVHFLTVAGTNGKKIPQKFDGYPIIQSVMITALFLKVKTIVEGVRKPQRNSGAPVRMSNIIKSVINKPTLDIKTLSLKDENYTAVRIDGNVIDSEFAEMLEVG